MIARHVFTVRGSLTRSGDGALRAGAAAKSAGIVVKQFTERGCNELPSRRPANLTPRPLRCAFISSACPGNTADRRLGRRELRQRTSQNFTFHFSSVNGYAHGQSPMISRTPAGWYSGRGTRRRAALLGVQEADAMLLSAIVARWRRDPQPHARASFTR